MGLRERLLEERIEELGVGPLVKARKEATQLRDLINKLEELIARNEAANREEKETLAVPSLISGVPDEELPPRGSEEAKALAEQEKAIIRRRIDAILESMDASRALYDVTNHFSLDEARQALKKAKADLSAVEAMERKEMDSYMAREKEAVTNAVRKELEDVLKKHAG